MKSNSNHEAPLYNKDTNFGDAINAWLWDRLLPGCLDEDDRVRLSGIGSILSGGMPDAERWIVFTSGVGYPPLPLDLAASAGASSQFVAL